MLSIVHAVTKFHCYVFGKKVTVYNDHKPLESIFKKPLNAAPMRLQRMLLKLQWYDVIVKYQKGETMYISDTLSRAYLLNSGMEDLDLKNVSMLDFLSITEDLYKTLQSQTEKELYQLKEVIQHGWPTLRSDVPIFIRKYWDARECMSELDGVIYKGLRIVVPPSLQKHMVRLIHKSHLGIVKCKQRAREVLFWPSMNAEIESAVKNCDKCATYQNKLQREPLQSSEVPELPFSVVGTDLFEFKSKHYLLLVDYYSKFIEVDELDNESSYCTIQTLKSQFCRHGILTTIRSDNGPQYNSREFADFCKAYGIQHKPSSPFHARSNGEAERAVQTVKRLWEKNDDKQLSLLDYRTTPLENLRLSPAQLLMGRRPRNLLPANKKLLEPTQHDMVEVRRYLQGEKNKQKFYYDKARRLDVTTNYE